MNPESPTEQIRAIRHKLAARFGNDLGRIVADLQEQERNSGRTYIRLPKREPLVRATVKREADTPVG